MSNPRLQVPVSEETRAALQAYADARGASLAAVCGELLEQTAPTVLEMAKALETAKKAPARALRDMSKAFYREMEKIDQSELDLSPKATGKKRAR